MFCVSSIDALTKYYELFKAKKLAGRGYVTLCSNSGEANFEEYREAWRTN